MPGQFRGARDVLADHVAFEIDAVAAPAPRSRFVCSIVYGTICTSNAIASEPGDRQADAVHRNRAFVDDVGGERRRIS